MVRAKLRDPEWVHRHRWGTLLVLCVSLMVIILDNTILNVALPTLAKPTSHGGLGASASELQWIVDAYTIVFAGLLLTAGSLGDRFGRYRGLVIGLSIFGTGSLLSAFATSATMLIATRALMGVGGAFIMPSTLSILTNVFTEPRERAKAIGIWAGVAGLAGLGPITGGILLSHFWWGSVFLVNVPIVAAGLVAGFFLIPDSRDPSHPRLDPGGALLSIAALGTLLWAIIEAPGRGWTATSILVAFGAGAVLLCAFVVWELTYSSPMLDMRFFKNPRFSAASGAISLTFLALFGMLFLLTQYFQIVLGYSTVKAGAVLLPQAAIMLVAAPLSSVFVVRLGNKIVVASGLFIVAACLLLLTTLNAHSSTLHVVVVVALLAVGMGNVMAPATDSIMGSLPRAKAGVGSAVNDTTRQIGGAVGVAVLGSLAASKFTSEMSRVLKGILPSSLLTQAKEGIAQAVGVAAQPSSQQFSGQIATAAKNAFVAGFHLADIVAAVIIAIAATCVLIWLPARAPREAAGPGPPRRARPGRLSVPAPEPAGGAGAVPWWPSGLWLGPPDLGSSLCATLSDVAPWTVAAPDRPVKGPVEGPVEPAEGPPPSILLNALALEDGTGAGPDPLLGLDPLVATIAAGGAPARVITILWGSWSGREVSAGRCGRSAMAFALTRHWALRLAPTGTTVNSVAVPVGFPDAPPPATAPVQAAAGLDDLAHVVRFFGHPDNGYVIGQTVSLCGGDFVWGNHSA